MSFFITALLLPLIRCRHFIRHTPDAALRVFAAPPLRHVAAFFALFAIAAAMLNDTPWHYFAMP